MEDEKPKTYTYRNVNNYARIIDQFRANGITNIPKGKVEKFVGDVQGKAKSKDLRLIDKSFSYASLEEYFSSYERKYISSPIRITPSAVEEITQAIEYVRKNKPIYTDAELVLIAITQMLRLHCVTLTSKDYTTSPKNFSAIVSSNEFWSNICTNSQNKRRSYRFVPREY